MDFHGWSEAGDTTEGLRRVKVSEGNELAKLASGVAREALARAEGATPGPWYHIKRIERRGAGTLKRASIKSSGEALEKYPNVHRRIICEETWDALPREDDLEFIAWAREGVPALAHALEETEARRKHMYEIATTLAHYLVFPHAAPLEILDRALKDLGYEGGLDDMADQALLAEIEEKERLRGENVRLRRKIASLEREKERLWKLVNSAEKALVDEALAGEPQERQGRKLELVEAERDMHYHFRACGQCRRYPDKPRCPEGDDLKERYRALSISNFVAREPGEAPLSEAGEPQERQGEGDDG